MQKLSPWSHGGQGQAISQNQSILTRGWTFLCPGLTCTLYLYLVPVVQYSHAYVQSYSYLIAAEVRRYIGLLTREIKVINLLYCYTLLHWPIMKYLYIQTHVKMSKSRHQEANLLTSPSPIYLTSAKTLTNIYGLTVTITNAPHFASLPQFATPPGSQGLGDSLPLPNLSLLLSWLCLFLSRYLSSTPTTTPGYLYSLYLSKCMYFWYLLLKIYSSILPHSSRVHQHEGKKRSSRNMLNLFFLQLLPFSFFYSEKISKQTKREKQKIKRCEK